MTSKAPPKGDQRQGVRTRSQGDNSAEEALLQLVLQYEINYHHRTLHSVIQEEEFSLTAIDFLRRLAKAVNNYIHRVIESPETPQNFDQLIDIVRKEINALQNSPMRITSALLLAILLMLRCAPNIPFKYPTYESYDKVYKNRYDETYDVDQKELENLYLTANWIELTSRFLKPKRNKGSYLYAVSKLLEGPNAEYITGSGQSAATARRVKIYETETEIPPAKRRRRPKPEKRDRIPSEMDGDDKPRAAQKSRKRKHSQKAEASHDQNGNGHSNEKKNGKLEESNGNDDTFSEEGNFLQQIEDSCYPEECSYTLDSFFFQLD